MLEVADIFRDHGAAWRRANVGHVSLDQMKVMSAIERCRTAALGGHVARCEDSRTPSSPTTAVVVAIVRSVGHGRQGMAHRARGRSAAGAVLHVVFTLPAAIADIAYQSKADLRHPVHDLGRDHNYHRHRSRAPRARIGITSSAPHLGLGADASSHIHMIVPAAASP